VTASHALRAPGISALIHTKNEESDIERVVRNASAVADEVVVIDMASEDRTREIAEALGARVYEVPDYGYVEPARAEGVDHCRREWILNLDADELVPEALATRLRSIADSNAWDVVYLSRVTFMFGARIKGSGWSLKNERHPRFYRAHHLVHHSELHAPSLPVPGARVTQLPPEDHLALIHFNYTDWAHFIAKLNRYTSIASNERLARGERPSAVRTALLMAREVLSRLIVDGGWRDGANGLGLAFAMAGYQLGIDLKLRQLIRVGGVDAIRREYARIAAAAPMDRRGPDGP
jgi:glycosyltransferase involved in cell wall biosynthesis